MLIANLYIQIVMGSLLFFTSLIMIFLILIQRGRGGGLAGALGGSGGSSAFGAKAGDTFTRITAVMAIFWFVLCLFTILLIQGPRVAPVGEREPTAGGGATVPAEKAPGPLVDLPTTPSLDLPKTGDTGTDATGTAEGDAAKAPAESSGTSPDAKSTDGDAGTTGGDAGSQAVPKTDGSGL
ncbi:MAG: preprotein translocase subunit SecG [Pirellulaceae bacterium]|nr:preprotein translocase subunit SecG [Pirellulaceae bacterium]